MVSAKPQADMIIVSQAIRMSPKWCFSTSGQRELDFQLRIAPPYSLKWNNMVHEGKAKAATCNRPVNMGAGTAQDKTGRAAYVPAEQAELYNRLPLGKAAY